MQYVIGKIEQVETELTKLESKVEKAANAYQEAAKQGTMEAQACSVIYADLAEQRKLLQEQRAGLLAMLPSGIGVGAGGGGAGGSGTNVQQSNHVRALDVVCSRTNRHYFASPSRTTTLRKYPEAVVVEWKLDPALIRSTLTSRLADVVLESDPRPPPTFDYLTCEDQINARFELEVGQPVATVLKKLGIPISFHKNPRSIKSNGLPDFTVTYDGLVEISGGEGKSPAALRSMDSVLPTAGMPSRELFLQKIIEQELSYHRDRDWNFGFLTSLQGLFGITRRPAPHTFAFTRAVAYEETSPSQKELLLYILLMAYDERSEQLQARAQEMRVSIEQPGQPQAHQGRGQYQSHAQQQQPSLPTQQQQQQQCTPAPKSECAASCVYPTHPDAAVVLDGGALGSGYSGVIAAGSYYGVQSAFKMADCCKEDILVDKLKHEIHIYGKLERLQGQCIPVLKGFGFWKSTFFLALSIIEGHGPSRRWLSALPQAEQALSRMHNLGVLHGDIDEDNIIIVPTDSHVQAFFLDFGESSLQVDADACAEELAQLRTLFRGSDDSTYSESCMVEG